MPVITCSTSLRHALGITITLLAIWVIPPVNDWFRAFVKLDPIRLPYTLMFFLLLFIALTKVESVISKKSFFVVSAIGAVLGQAIALVSLLIANFFIPNGFERTIRTIAREGAITVLAIDFTVAFILGGWIIGAIALNALKFMGKKT